VSRASDTSADRVPRSYQNPEAATRPTRRRRRPHPGGGPGRP